MALYCGTELWQLCDARNQAFHLLLLGSSGHSALQIGLREPLSFMKVGHQLQTWTVTHLWLEPHSKHTHTHTLTFSPIYTFMNLAIEAVHKCMDRVYYLHFMLQYSNFFFFLLFVVARVDATRWFLLVFSSPNLFCTEVVQNALTAAFKLYIKEWYVIHILGIK